jgi:NADP-dependent 3-hydroxy acid dehydrogenase YdfG
MTTNRRVALVTGSTSGVGEAVAGVLLEHGWRVLGIGRRHPSIEHAEYQHLRIDLGNTAELAPAIEREVHPILAGQWDCSYGRRQKTRRCGW